MAIKVDLRGQAQQGIVPEGVYIAWLWYGTPGSRYGMRPTRRITEVDGKPTADASGGVPYIALVPIAVTADNILETVIADGFDTIENICTGDVAETQFCIDNA